MCTDGEGRRTEEEEDEDGPAAFICFRQTTSSLSFNRHTDRRREKEIWNVLSVLPSSLSIPPEMPQCPPAAMYHRGLAMGSSFADAFYNLPDFFSPKGGREREAARKPLSFSSLPVWFDPCMAKGGTEGVEKRGWVVVGPPQDERIILVYKVCLLLC